jgi:hypothetical protein
MAILRGNDKNATAREKHIGSNVAKVQTSFPLLVFYLDMDVLVSWFPIVRVGQTINFSIPSVFWI